MDGEKKCLILSNRAYEEYLQIETRRQQSKAEEPVKKEEKTQENTKEKGAKNEKLAPEVQKIIDQGMLLSERSTSVMKPFREKRFPQRSAGWRCW